MRASQLLALAILLLMIGGLAFSFVRKGAKLKRDDNPDNWAGYTGGSDGSTGGDGASPSA